MDDAVAEILNRAVVLNSRSLFYFISFFFYVFTININDYVVDDDDSKNLIPPTVPPSSLFILYI